MSKVVMTYRDYAALPDDGKRYELYDGELIELTSPTLRHQRASGGCTEPSTNTFAATLLARFSWRRSMSS